MPKKYILYLVKKQNVRNGLIAGQIVAVHPEGYEPSQEDRFNHDIIEVPESEYRNHLIDFEKAKESLPITCMNLMANLTEVEQKKKIGDAHRGKKISEEQKKIISERHKGKKISEETRIKMKLTFGSSKTKTMQFYYRAV